MIQNYNITVATTVKPQYSGQPRGIEKMSTIEKTFT